MTIVKLSLKEHLKKKYPVDAQGNLTGPGITALSFDLRVNRGTAKKIARDDGGSISFKTLGRIVDVLDLEIKDILITEKS